jgi:hypothetical protein
MTMELPNVGKQGETCPECGSALATDQRYCVNCGWRRGDPRVDYETQVLNAGRPALAGAARAQQAPARSFQQSPLFALGTIAVLGIFLLLGVLIGKDNNSTTQTVAAQAPATTTTAATPTTDTTTTTASKTKSAKGTGAGTAPGQGSVVQGGTGSTSGIQTADTGASVQQNAKNGPDQVATGGKPAALDPNGQAGGGSSATCIGC